MRKRYIYLFSFIISYFFTSCYSLPQVGKSSRFEPGEKNGYILMKLIINGDPAGLSFRITKTDRFPPGIAEWYNFSIGENIIFAKAPPGEYMIHYIFDRSPRRAFTDFELKHQPFTLEGGGITYLGDMIIEPAERVNGSGSRVFDFRYHWRDTYDETVFYVRDRYGGIPGDMPFVNRAPQDTDTYYEPVITGGY